MISILVVDDEESIRNLLRDMLENEGYEVNEAADGKEAILAFKKSPTDIVITDLVMPEKNGIDVIMELKKINQDIRVIAISGGGGITGNFDYLPIAKLVGAITVLKKPFSLADIKSAVTNALNH